MAIIVERVNRNGQVLQTFVVEKDVCKIGRSFSGDVILHDEHVDAEHLEIRKDPATNNLICEDRSATNGVWLLQQWKKALTFKQRIKLEKPRLFYSGQGFVIGRTFLRVYSSDHQVSPTLPLSSWEVVDYVLGRWYVALAAMLLLVALGLYDQYMASPRFDHLLKASRGLGAIVVSCLVFAGACSMLGRLLRHDAKYFVYASMAFMGLAIMYLVELVLPVIAYNTGLWGPVLSWLEDLVFVGLLFLVGYLTVFFATQLSSMLRLGVASILPVLFLASQVFNIIDQPDFRSRPGYNHGLVAPRWQFIEPITAEQFLEKAEEVYAPAEESAAALYEKSK